MNCLKVYHFYEETEEKYDIKENKSLQWKRT